MKSAWKIAFVAPAWTAWQHRLMTGALRFADANARVHLRGLAPVKDMRETARQLEEWGAQGILGHMAYEDVTQLQSALANPPPIVNTALSKEQPGVVTIVGDFSTFIQTAVDHVRQLGVRSLALLVLEEGPAIQKNLVGTFLNAVGPSGPDRATLVCHPPNQASIWTPEASVKPIPKPLVRWLRNLPKPVGVLCPELGGGGYLIRCCKVLGLKVPEDVAVVGADDMDLSLASTPTLTSVIPALESMGFEALSILVGMLEGNPPPPATIRLRCAELRVRDSTGLRRPEICDIAAALRCIDEHACRRINVKQVIKQTQRVSHVTFHRRFQEVVGKSPGQAIRDRKLAEVRRLLLSTELPVAMVADLAGFRTPKELARAFRAAEHTTPRDYRKEHRKPKRA